MFNEEKVSQMAALLLHKRGGRMSYLKLIKLLYLADREALAQCGESLSGDIHYSMKHGPVLSKTYDFINDDGPSVWNDWFNAEANHEISLKNMHLNDDDLDELSAFDKDILNSVWQEHGYKKRWEIVDFTHDNLPEWVNPGTSSIAIDPRKQFQALGKTAEQAEMLNDALIEKRALAKALAEVC